MGGQMAAGGGGNKAQTQATNTGQPNWTSGGTGSGTAGGAATNLGSGGVEPGTEAYNQMNSNLATAPMESLTNIFGQGGMTGGMNQASQNLLNSTGSNNWMNQAANAFGQLGGPEGTANFQNLYNQAGQPGAQQQYLTQFANGSQVMNNPYLEGIIQKGQDEAGTGINQMFAKGGRYGSPTNYGTIADSYQDVGNKFRGEQLNQDLTRQMQAAQGISQEQLGRMGVQSGAAQGVGGLQQAGATGLGGLGQNAMQNWMGAQQTGAGLQNQGIQNMLGAMGQLGNVQNNKMFDANVQQGVGQQVDQASQQQLNDLINQWTQGDMQDWARLGGLTSAGTSTAGNWGTQSGTQTSQQGGSGMGTAASILGGVLSMFSDRRLKQDIERLEGQSFAGLPLYHFRYKHDPDVLQVGVMSDDVRKLYPEAVSVSPEGYDVVDYGLLISRN